MLLKWLNNHWKNQNGDGKRKMSNKKEYDRNYQAVQRVAQRIVKQNPKINYQEARQQAQKIAQRHDSKNK